MYTCEKRVVSSKEDAGANEATSLVHEEAEEHHHDDHHHEDHHHLDHQRSLGENVPLYSPPKQRQRWGEVHMLPHVNWGDLFFDLFYVAAAFNLDAIMEEEPSRRSLFFYISCYIPIFVVWMEKLGYDARYALEDNLFHRSVEISHLIILATIVQHVRPANIMISTSLYPDTMVFALGLFVDCFLCVKMFHDIYVNAHGGQEAKRHAFDDIRRKLISSIFHLGATILAGYDYFFLPPTHRANPIPILLCLLGALSEQVYHVAQFGYIIPNSSLPMTELRVPMNLEFTLHRMGEWVMLMLGETVLNLLITPASDRNVSYYVSFYTGILAVTMLQYLYFRSQPFEVDDHAFRRSAVGGWLYFQMMLVYSGTLILFGGSYKLMLDQYHLEQLHHGTNARVGLFTLEERRIRIANIFSWSLTVGVFALDVMILTHRGFEVNYSRFVSAKRGINPMPAFIACLNVSLTIFTATLSQWVTSLELLSLLGVVIIFAQVLLRTLGLRHFPVSKAAMLKACQWCDPTLCPHDIV